MAKIIHQPFESFDLAVTRPNVQEGIRADMARRNASAREDVLTIYQEIEIAVVLIAPGNVRPFILRNRDRRVLPGTRIITQCQWVSATNRVSVSDRRFEKVASTAGQALKTGISLRPGGLDPIS